MVYIYEDRQHILNAKIPLMKGYPKKTSEMFPGIPDKVDTSFVDSGDIFFVSGIEYYKGHLPYPRYPVGHIPIPIVKGRCPMNIRNHPFPRRIDIHYGTYPHDGIVISGREMFTIGMVTISNNNLFSIIILHFLH